jgi:hypothetical protein
LIDKPNIIEIQTKIGPSIVHIGSEMKIMRGSISWMHQGMDLDGR